VDVDVDDHGTHPASLVHVHGYVHGHV